MGLQAVFIDVGNTLLYEKPSRFEIYARAARRRGREVSTCYMTELMHKVHRELPREIEGEFRYSDRWFEDYIDRIFHRDLAFAREDLPGVLEELFGCFSDERTFQLFPGARECLEEFRAQDLVCGVISNWSPRLPGLLRSLEIDGLFDFVLCSAIERMEKPDAAIFERALALAGVEPGRALHAGDHPEKDVRAARALGIGAVLVDHHGAHAGEDLPSVDNLGALRDHVLERVA